MLELYYLVTTVSKKLSLASIPSQQSCSKEQARVDHCKSVTSPAV